MTFVAIGDNCLDVYIQTDETYVGGNALNVAVSWAREGRKTRYLGAVGDDPAAALVVSALDGQGVASSDVATIAGRTGVTLVELNESDRRFVHEEFGVGATWLPPDALLDTLTDGDWAHLAGIDLSRGIVQDLTRRGARVSLDLSTHGIPPELDGVDVCFASAPDSLDDAHALGQRIIAAGARTALVTAGGAGSVGMDTAGAYRQPAEPVSVLDTCGAGDSYIAATIGAIADGHDLSDAMRLGTLAAAVTCTHTAGFPQTPTRTLPWIIDTYYPHAGASTDSAHAGRHPEHTPS
ncbi:PfkB family carbohydrate kinase [Microbacterium aurum]